MGAGGALCRWLEERARLACCGETALGVEPDDAAAQRLGVSERHASPEGRLNWMRAERFQGPKRDTP
ncbi:hypothetical protein ACFDR8_002064 [Arthrobacter sp. MP_2.3]